jgi:calcineurin-like phosphoesterase family protein
MYHVGDFAFADHDPYLRRLNGEKHLVPGNHDHRSRIERAPLWHTVGDKLTHIEVMGDIQVVLCHYAMRVWRNARHGAPHFYGHSHGNLPGDAQSLDVGVDCWDFAPASFDRIVMRLMDQRERVESDHHQPKSPVTARREMQPSDYCDQCGGPCLRRPRHGEG